MNNRRAAFLSVYPDPSIVHIVANKYNVPLFIQQSSDYVLWSSVLVNALHTPVIPKTWEVWVDPARQEDFHKLARMYRCYASGNAV